MLLDPDGTYIWTIISVFLSRLLCGADIGLSTKAAQLGKDDRTELGTFSFIKENDLFVGIDCQ